MGSKNRERRRVKQRAREERHRQQRRRAEQETSSPFGERRVDPALLVNDLVGQALSAMQNGDERTALRCRDSLVSGVDRLGGQPAVDTALVTIAQRSLSGLWQRGWQPADVVRLVRREHGSGHARIAVDLVAAEMRAYAPATVDERWEAQLRELGATVWWNRDDEWLSAAGTRERLDRPELVHRLLRILLCFVTCPPIETLCPPPGQARRGSRGPNRTAGTAGRSEHGGQVADPRQLGRVRALLAKAESTPFAEEAEVCTAKAQELMTRHSIDDALLAAGDHDSAGDEPVGRRIGIDNPYEAPKVLLLGVVAEANRCRSVWAKAFAHVTVLGFPTDLDAVELLFTSLLVQATTAMTREGTHTNAAGRSTTRAFRQSFLTAYAGRIGERLAETAQQTTEQARRDLAGQPGADRLLPVLASRDDAVQTKVAEFFPNLVSRAVSVTNREGWASGRAAADQAQLTTLRSVAD